MGQIIRYRCSECGYEKELHEGCGMRMPTAEQIRRIFSEEERSGYEWNRQAGTIKSISLEQEICFCRKCKDYVSTQVLSYQIGSTELQVRKHCPVCDSALEKTEEAAECPKCGTELTIEQAGLWD